MKRFAIGGLVTVMAMAFAGCGMVTPLSTTEREAEASGLFSPKLPKDRVLLAEEWQGDFDRYLRLAQGEATRWSEKAVFTGAQALNVDAKGGKAGGTTYVYSFASGKHGLAVTISGTALSFAKAKPGIPVDTQQIVSGARAMAAAMETGRLSHEGFVLLLTATETGPVYLVQEFKKEKAASVIVDARTGKALR